MLETVLSRNRIRPVSENINPVLLVLGVYFYFLGVFLAAKFRGLFECFLFIFQGFQGLVGRNILGVFEVFLGVF